ncbi:CPBP family intramembrane glutamic endopeptidase [Nocardiopsis protaetiae]|uniref:CPBP family intramembrane glutamic endopeptidase n=1 Tax=Nocardiopsis protaetiae TaxID=3382270 RepID=UPI00387AB625
MNPDEHPRTVPPAEPAPVPGTAPAWGPPPPAPRHRGPRPVPPGVEYHRVLSGEKRRIWRGILAIVLLIGGMLLFSTLLGFGAIFVDTLTGRSDPMAGEIAFTPLFNAANLLALALLIPWSMLIQRWLYKVRGASLHSVLSHFRLRLFGRALAVIGPVWTVYMVVFFLLMPYEEGVWTRADLIVMFASTLLLVPLQAAGEEYGFRGLVFRIAAGWGRGPRTALVVGVLVSSLAFMSVHFAADPWLNLYYFTFGATLALVTWRTGGLEVAVVVHAVNNTIAFLLVLFARADLESGFDRSVGAGSALMLVPCAMLVALTAVVWWTTRRTGPPLTPAEPGPAPSPAV